MNDNQFPDTATPPKASVLPPIPTQPALTFAQVLAAVGDAPGLTPGVRGNMRSSVRRTASLMSNAGLSHQVNIAAINKRFLKLTPRQVGFKTSGSLSAYISNFGRSLRLAGFTIMPGRHQTQLTPAWADLLAMVTDVDLHRRLTRLFHVASEQGWVPTNITDAHLDRFRSLVQQTCLKSKADEVVRNTIKAWNIAHKTILGWPGVALDAGKTSDWYYSLPWAKFPASFRADVDAYLDRGVDLANDNFLDADVALPPLKPRTQANYRDALLRSASILVRHDVDPHTISTIADLVSPERVNRILMFLAQRTSRKEGGLLGYVSLILYMASRDWVHKVLPKAVLPADVMKLKSMFEVTKQKNFSMSDNTWRRLSQFDDPAVMDAYWREPGRLIRLVAKRPVDAKSANLVRLALFIAISLDTLLRPGDVVDLEHDRHLMSHGTGAGRKIYVHVPAARSRTATRSMVHCGPRRSKCWSCTWTSIANCTWRHHVPGSSRAPKGATGANKMPAAR